LNALDLVGKRFADQQGPIGERLRKALISAIEEGVLPPRDALPAEREMAAALGVSRSTVRQSLKELGEMGLVQTRHGARTVVTGRIPKALSKLSGFTEDMRMRGLQPGTRVLKRLIGPVAPETAVRTGLPLGTQVLTLERLRMAGGEALSYETAIVPLACVGQDYDGTGSLYERMDLHGARPRRILQTLEALDAPPAIADLLDIDVGAAVLKVAQVGYGADGIAVEDAVSWYRGDRYKYVGEIEG